MTTTGVSGETSGPSRTEKVPSSTSEAPTSRRLLASVPSSRNATLVTCNRAKDPFSSSSRVRAATISSCSDAASGTSRARASTTRPPSGRSPSSSCCARTRATSEGVPRLTQRRNVRSGRSPAPATATSTGINSPCPGDTSTATEIRSPECGHGLFELRLVDHDAAAGLARQLGQSLPGGKQRCLGYGFSAAAQQLLETRERTESRCDHRLVDPASAFVGGDGLQLAPSLRRPPKGRPVRLPDCRTRSTTRGPTVLGPTRRPSARSPAPAGRPRSKSGRKARAAPGRSARSRYRSRRSPEPTSWRLQTDSKPPRSEAGCETAPAAPPLPPGPRARARRSRRAVGRPSRRSSDARSRRDQPGRPHRRTAS